MSQAVCWIDGNIVPLSEAMIPVMDHGLLYGDGVFEGIRFYNGVAFLLHEHLQRLADSARAIALSYEWNNDELAGIVQQVIAASDMRDGYIRLLITRGEGALGIDPKHCKQPRLIVIADKLQMVDNSIREHGATVVIASTRRLPSDGLDARIKSLNYLNHILARIEANQAQADEAVLLNTQGRVTEGSADNLFIVKRERLLTPPVSDGALAGITRALILELAQAAGIDSAEQSLAPYDLYTADECFLSGTGAELIPVKQIDGRQMTACPGKVYQLLNERFQATIQQACSG